MPCANGSSGPSRSVVLSQGKGSAERMSPQVLFLHYTSLYLSLQGNIWFSLLSGLWAIIPERVPPLTTGPNILFPNLFILQFSRGCTIRAVLEFVCVGHQVSCTCHRIVILLVIHERLSGSLFSSVLSEATKYHLRPVAPALLSANLYIVYVHCTSKIFFKYLGIFSCRCAPLE